MGFSASPIFKLGSGPPVDPTEWVRPANWLPITAIAGEQKIQILVAISTDTSSDVNRVVAFLATGNYTVNWGDGSANENFSGGTVAKHTFDPTGLTDLEPGWKQVLVTVTPQGANLLTFNGEQQFYTGKTTRQTFLEIVVATPSLTVLQCTGSYQQFLQHIAFLGEPTLGTLLISNNQEMRAIEGNIKWNNTAVPTFQNNYKQTVFPTFTTFLQNVTLFSNTFNNCYAMVEPPVLPMDNVTSATNAFGGCRSMKTVPTWVNTSKCTNVSGLFSGCISLREITLDVSLATTINNLFADCISLTKVTLIGAFNTGATNYQQMFFNCAMLERINGTLNCSGGTTNILSWISPCTRLRYVTFGPGQAPKVTWTFAGMADAATLNAIYTALPTVTGQTFTVSNVPGTVGDDPSIATAKGWAVTGS